VTCEISQTRLPATDEAAVNAGNEDPVHGISTMYRWLKSVGYFLFFLGIGNFLAFWVVVLAIGGDAVSGKVLSHWCCF
jgi:hypothetical protein